MFNKSWWKQRKFWLGSLVAIGFLVATVGTSPLIPPVFQWIIVGLSIIWLLLATHKIKRWVQWLVAICCVLLSWGLFYAQSISERVFVYIPVETNIYSFLVVADSEIETLHDAQGENIGIASYFDWDLQVVFMEEIFNEFDFTPEFTVVDSDFAAVEQLFAGQLAVMIIDNAMWELLVDEDHDFPEKVKVIWEVSKTFVRENIEKNVNVSVEPFIVYISGVDTEGSLSERARTDANMLMIIHPIKGEITLVQIPRDTYMPVACKRNAMDKLTHTGIFGIDCSIKSIENFLDIDINYFVRLNFTSFIEIIDVIGGITVENEIAFVSHSYQVPFEVGTLRLSGFSALEFARERYAFESGDIQRGKNQQTVIQAIIKKMTSPASLFKVEGMVNQVAKSIDTNFPVENVQNLVRLQLSKRIDWKFTTAYIGGSHGYNVTYSMGNRRVYVFTPRASSVKEVSNLIKQAMQ